MIKDMKTYENCDNVREDALLFSFREQGWKDGGFSFCHLGGYTTTVADPANLWYLNIFNSVFKIAGSSSSALAEIIELPTFTKFVRCQRLLFIILGFVVKVLNHLPLTGSDLY